MMTGLIIVLAIIGTLLAVSFIILFHELGHYLAARLFKVKICEFAIGFGKTLTRVTTKRGEEFSIKLIPLGGYVRLLDERDGFVSDKDIGHAFNRKSFSKKFIIIAAGPFMNGLLALLLFFAVAMIGSKQIQPVVHAVIPGSIAMQAGIEAQSQIKTINGEEISSWFEVAYELLVRLGGSQPIDMTIETSSGVKEVQLPIAQWQLDKLRPDILLSLGIVPNLVKGSVPTYAVKKLGVSESIKDGFYQSWLFMKINAVGFYQIIKGHIALSSLAGPFAIFEKTFYIIQTDFMGFLQFLAYLSLAIGMINLLPIPALDGGGLMFLFIEKMTGRPLSLSAILLAYRLGWIALIVIMIHVTMNDMQRFMQPSDTTGSWQVNHDGPST